jgi:hypothetical protein
MSDVHQNRIATAAPASRWCNRVGFLPRLQLGFLACMNDVLNGGEAKDFVHWAVPGEHAVLDAVEDSAGLPKELPARSRAKLRPPVENILFEAAGR